MARLPMILTWSRIIAGPIIAAIVISAASLSFSDPQSSGLLFAGAAVLFVLAALTDWLDGALARKMGTVSPLGAALDHGADKVLTGTVLIALAYAALSADLVIAALLIVGRDALLAALREGFALSGRALPVSQGGKWKTGLLLTAIIALLAAQVSILLGGGEGVVAALSGAGRALLWAAAALALWSAAGYLSHPKKNLDNSAP
jgi:CDP-diacylglycerol--glycerol-3-phosphate 3-phosphatidyltransferase